MDIDLSKILILIFLIARTFKLISLHIVMLIVFTLLELARFIAYSNGIGVHLNYIPFTNHANPNEIISNLYCKVGYSILYVYDFLCFASSEVKSEMDFIVFDFNNNV